MNCVNFNGYKPCSLQKTNQVDCCPCDKQRAPAQRILLIKVGRAGDVVRTAPILNYLTPKSLVVWVTDYPEIVDIMIAPNDITLRSIDFKNNHTRDILKTQHFDVLINLDKDAACCSLAQELSGKCFNSYGFTMDIFGNTTPFNHLSEKKWKMGIDDNYMRSIKESYIQTTLEQIGYKWEGDKIQWGFPTSLMTREFDVCLVPFVGKTWPARYWGDKGWNNLIAKLLKENISFKVLFAPGDKDGTNWLSYFPEENEVATYFYEQWFEIISQSKVVVCQPSLGMNIASALDKPVILLNNVFSKYEFLNELPPKSTIMDKKDICTDCYNPNCKNNCLENITYEKIYSEIIKIL